MVDAPEDLAMDCKHPPRYKLAILTFIGLLAPVYFIPKSLNVLFPSKDFLVTIVAVGIIVFLMTYMIMPILKWVFRDWINLHPHPK